jgi:predicted DNA-binding transcriptional regulator AlpA
MSTQELSRKPDVAPDPDGIVSPRETRGLLADISEATLWRMVERGDLPRPISISPGRKGFRRRDILAFIERRAAS